MTVGGSNRLVTVRRDLWMATLPLPGRGGRRPISGVGERWRAANSPQAIVGAGDSAEPPERPRGSRRHKSAALEASIEKGASGHLKGLGELLDNRDGRIARTTFEIADVGPVEARTVGKVFLRPGLLVANPSQVGAEALDDVHRASRPRCR